MMTNKQRRQMHDAIRERVIANVNESRRVREHTHTDRMLRTLYRLPTLRTEIGTVRMTLALCGFATLSKRATMAAFALGLVE